ncbi:hypothetical protein [Roseivivax isoporae]|uniref:Uncharacterized protein n=1 Tax=Roseivivax isoporae LMG 25204 TaxID=1449351 RepID=X7FDC7_9RHOB|nr:hypothetical protein [Roseivivax isoporae]ETX30029.1 hypothetical protein RISW2_20055 [Roseivivax isoporae LMG 25204]
MQHLRKAPDMTQQSESRPTTRADQALAILADQLSYFTPDSPARPVRETDEMPGFVYYNAA